MKHTQGVFEGGADSLTVRFNERVEPPAINQVVVSGLKVSNFATIMAHSAVSTGTNGSTTVWGQTARRP